MSMIKSFLRRIFTPERLAFLLGIMAFCAVVVIVFDQAVMPYYTKHGEALAVPNIIAKRFEAAKEILTAEGLEVIKAGEMHDANLPFGYVVDQNPRPNRLVKKGRRVYLTISSGEREVKMPNLLGLSETNALEQLKSFGLIVGDIEYEYVADELPDVVIRQSHAPQTIVSQSALIDIAVSLGKPTENVIVPNLFGKTLKDAKREITKAGFSLGNVTYKVSHRILPNTVLKQSLEAGKRASFGDKIDLMVTTVSGSEN